MKKRKIVVLGAGITGLSTAIELLKSKQFDVTILEKDNKVGGLASTFKYGKFKLDYGPHKFYTELPHIQKYVEGLLGDLLLKKKKISGIYFKNYLFNYPPSMSQVTNKIGFISGTRALSSYFSYKISSFALLKKQLNFEDSLISKFGPYFYNLFFKEQSEKLWGKPTELSLDLVDTRFGIESLRNLLNLLIGKKGAGGSADYFYYPKGGIGVLPEVMAGKIVEYGGNIFLNSKAIEIRCNSKKAVEITWSNANGQYAENVDYLISTIPINSLNLLLKPSLLREEKMQKLQYRSLILCYLFYKSSNLLGEKGWIFFPEKKYVFGRLSEQSKFDDAMGPRDESALCADIRCGLGDELWQSNDEDIKEMVLKGIKEFGIKDEPYSSLIIKIPNIYPLYTRNYKTDLSEILIKLSKIENLYSIGRHGLFNYNNMDHCIDIAIKASEAVSNNITGSEFWETLKDKLNYKIID